MPWLKLYTLSLELTNPNDRFRPEAAPQNRPNPIVRTSANGKSGLSDFLNVSDSAQAEFAKIPIARVFLGAIQ